MALIAALIDVLKVSKSRTLLSLPFPEILRDNTALSKNVTICSMQVFERDSALLASDSSSSAAAHECRKIPLYTLKRGLSSLAEGLHCGLIAGIKPSTMRRAEQVKQSLNNCTHIPVAHDMTQVGSGAFDQEEKRYLRNFLVA